IESYYYPLPYKKSYYLKIKSILGVPVMDQSDKISRDRTCIPTESSWVLHLLSQELLKFKYE
ncbi:hypothetical protein PS003_24065, partial [Shigella sonnei]|nr:hypothetical protein [Shigella sonnei]